MGGDCVGVYAMLRTPRMLSSARTMNGRQGESQGRA